MTTEYSIKQIEINADSLEDLKKMKHPRAISTGHVTKLFKALKEQGHFDQPFVVNKKGKEFILIDGNHRFEAYKKWIEEDNSNNGIQDFYIYDNLTPEEEVSVYTKWNSGKKQSSNDFVYLQQDWIPMLKLKDRLPVKISLYPLKSGEQGVPLSGIMKAYFFATRPGPENILKPYQTSQQKFVDDLKEVNEQDIAAIGKFMEFFQKIFGRMEKDNSYQTTTGLNVLMALYMRNVPGRISEEKLVSKVKRRVWMSSMWMQMSQSGGRIPTMNLYRFTLDTLNENILDAEKQLI